MHEDVPTIETLEGLDQEVGHLLAPQPVQPRIPRTEAPLGPKLRQAVDGDLPAPGKFGRQAFPKDVGAGADAGVAGTCALGFCVCVFVCLCVSWAVSLGGVRVCVYHSRHCLSHTRVCSLRLAPAEPTCLQGGGGAGRRHLWFCPACRL